MAEKRFSIPDYCTVRSIELIIPPGNRGKNKMLPKYISYKTAENIKDHIKRNSNYYCPSLFCT